MDPLSPSLPPLLRRGFLASTSSQDQVNTPKTQATTSSQATPSIPPDEVHSPRSGISEVTYAVLQELLGNYRAAESERREDIRSNQRRNSRSQVLAGQANVPSAQLRDKNREIFEKLFAAVKLLKEDDPLRKFAHEQVIQISGHDHFKLYDAIQKKGPPPPNTIINYVDLS